MAEVLSIIGRMDTAYSLDVVRTIQWQSPPNRLATAVWHFCKWVRCPQSSEEDGAGYVVPWRSRRTAQRSYQHLVTVQLWDGRTGHPIVTFTGHSGPVNPVTFSAGTEALFS